MNCTLYPFRNQMFLSLNHHADTRTKRMREGLTRSQHQKWHRRVFYPFMLLATMYLVINEITSTHISRRLGAVLDNIVPRNLSIYLGNGQCEWQPPTFDVPENETFTKTLVAGYPSGDKRLTFVQMEALTGLSARDEWDFAAFVVSQEMHSSLCMVFCGCKNGNCIFPIAPSFKNLQTIYHHRTKQRKF